MSTINISIKWGAEVLPVEIDTTEPIATFKMQLYSLTRVPPESQKIMVPRVGAIRDDATWDKYKPKDGAVWMLVGTAEDKRIQKTDIKTVFVEDLASTKKVTKHRAGLANLGNTCYMNSAIQMLAAIPELERSLASYTGSGNNEAEISISRSIRDLLAQMNQQDHASPLGFLLQFREVFPNFAEQSEHGGYAQQDSEECLSQLITCLRQVPSKTVSDNNIAAHLFAGRMRAVSKCLTGDEPVEEEETTFNKLCCHIGSTTSFLHEGLKDGMVENLTKRSATRGIDAEYTKQSSITKLPPYLCIQFMRFWWNDRAQVKAKITRPVEFPLRLDMFDYCAEELKEKLAPVRKAMVESNATATTTTAAASDSMEVEAQPAVQTIIENETGQYELQAVIAHRGRVADSGHYVAWTKDAEGNWVLYDDETVTPVSVEDVKLLSGKGGADWHIAYVCLYASVPKPANLVIPQTDSSSTSTTSTSETQ